MSAVHAAWKDREAATSADPFIAAQRPAPRFVTCPACFGHGWMPEGDQARLCNYCGGKRQVLAEGGTR